MRLNFTREQLASYTYFLLLDVNISDYSHVIEDDNYMLVKINSSTEQLMKDEFGPIDDHELYLGRYLLAINDASMMSRSKSFLLGMDGINKISRVESYLRNKHSERISCMTKPILMTHSRLYKATLRYQKEPSEKLSKLTISLASIKDMVTILGYNDSLISINDIDVTFILLKLIHLKDRRHIFRGIDKIYNKNDGISSLNYRNNKDLTEFLDLQKHEKEIADRFNTKSYAGQKTYINALSVSRHLGHDTSFIDFTEDPMVALYFACQKTNDMFTIGEIIYFDRTILEKRDDIHYTVHEDFVIHPTEDDLIKERVRTQKSIFVYACKGYLPRDKYQHKFHRLLIDRTLKSFLSEKSGLREDDIYPDKMGFFDNRENFITYPKRLYSAKAKMGEEKHKDALPILNECKKNYGPSFEINNLIDECEQEIKKTDTDKNP